MNEAQIWNSDTGSAQWNMKYRLLTGVIEVVCGLGQGASEAVAWTSWLPLLGGAPEIP